MKKLITICITIILVVAIITAAIVFVNYFNSIVKYISTSVENHNSCDTPENNEKTVNISIITYNKCEPNVNNKAEETTAADTTSVVDAEKEPVNNCFKSRIKVDYVKAKLGTGFDYSGKDCVNHSDFTYINEPSNYAHDLYINENGCIFESTSTHNHNAQIYEFDVNGKVYYSIAEYLKDN